MKRYAVTEGSRQSLADDIADHITRDEHLNPEKINRIEAYQRCLTALQYDAIEVQARHIRYRVIEAVPSTSGVCEGSLEEIVAELEQYGADRTQQGKEAKARAIARALHALEAGAIAVRVEGTLYRVVED